MIRMVQRWGLLRRRMAPLAVAAVLICLMSFHGIAHAQTAPNDFALQVSPSPLVATIKPGVPTDLELKIRNAGSTTETLKIEPRSFKLDSTTGEVRLNDTAPPDVAPWVSFSAPNFNVKSGDWFTEKVHIALPKDAGFSYSFALLISRKASPQPTAGGRLLKGSLAVFTLVNVDRPGSTRQLDIASFTSSRKFYEYLPTSLNVRFKNSGNSIVQPYGNIYLQRSPSDSSPISTLPVNANHSYILPGSTRSLKAEWTDGFPVYKDGKLTWNWANVANLRIGKYTAKLVGVYNDGNRDVPIVKTISFWVIPWKILLGLLLVCLLVLFSVGSIIWKLIKFARRGKRSKKSTSSNTSQSSGTPPETS